MFRSTFVGAAVAALVGSTGCVVEPSGGEVVYDNCPSGAYCGGAGDLVLSWSIDGNGTGALCASHGAAQIEVTITDATGNTVDDWTATCAAGATDETLAPGSYTATARLEDASGKPVTTSDPSTIAIYAGASSPPLDFDFDEDSFTNGT